MAAEVPTFEPEWIIAGDTAKWRRFLDAYSPAEGWSLSYSLVRRGTGDQITFTATEDEGTFLVNVPAATTQAWLAGDYDAQAYVTLDPDRFVVWEGVISIRVNLAGANVGDVRSHARKVLDAIEAVLEGRASQEVLEFTVEGTVLRKAPVADLLKLRDRYVVIARLEDEQTKIQSGRSTGRRVLTQFSNPAGKRGMWWIGGWE